ncbi:MAG: TRAP transporter small permease subunit [Gammaproteobacteria bacterium]
MENLLTTARKVARFGTWFGGGLLIAAALIIGVEVVIRKAFDMSIGGADELSGFALAIGSAWSFAFALLDRAHVRIDSLYVVLPVRICAVLDILGLAALILFMGLVSWFGFGVFAKSAELGARTMSPLATPLVVPQGLWVAGLILFMLVAVLLLARAFMALLSGEPAVVQQLIGSRTVVQEIEEELRDVAQRRSSTEGNGP